MKNEKRAYDSSDEFLKEVSSHDYQSFEIDANRRAYRYFGKPLDWDELAYPLENYMRYGTFGYVYKLKK